jgi:DNA polymerase-1
MKKPKIAILDGDIIAYRAAFWSDAEGIDELEGRLKHDVKQWTPEGCSAVVSLSCSRRDNFRRDCWASYKGHRDFRPDPDNLAYSMELIKGMSNIKTIPRLEADDIMGIGASSGTAIAVTIDKDLCGVPGWHWNPDKEKNPRFITEEEANDFFVCQIISGDTTDNIPGLPKCGKKFFEKAIQCFDAEDRYQETWWAFEERGYDYEYFLSQARCVRILRMEDYDVDTQQPILWDIPKDMP